jgi:hypothetical protein
MSHGGYPSCVEFFHDWLPLEGTLMGELAGEDNAWEESDEGQRLLRQYHRQRNRRRHNLSTDVVGIASLMLCCCIAGCIRSR